MEQIMSEERLLGLLDDAKRGISETILEKLESLASIDLTLERRAFLALHRQEEPHIEALELELKRFLSLPLLEPLTERPFAPSLRVDALWHDLILNTRRYRALCDELYGSYLDHTPNQEERIRELDDDAEAIGEFTNSALEKYYGGIDMAIWGSEIHRPGGLHRLGA
jgi:hypothetical protein